jgi:signal transduction histidine kinase
VERGTNRWQEGWDGDPGGGSDRSAALLRAAALFLGVPLLLGLLEAAQLYVRNGMDARPIPVSQALLLTLPRWLLLGALAPAVAALAVRVPIGHGRRLRAIAIHLAAGAMFALVHLAACVVVYGFLIEGIPNRFPARLSRLLTVYLAGDLLVYGALVGAVTAFRESRAARQRALAASRLEAQFAAARLDALRSQLNPHFLFNALNVTSVMAMKGEREAAVRMLGALADLLRVALDPQLPHEVPLSAELAIADGYIAIQTARFPDRLTVRKEIARETLDALVPSMLLQPLLENAIQHGIAARPGPGVVSIRAWREEMSLQLEVRDTGPGFGSDPVAPGTSGTSRVGATGGIGLNNTRARLHHLYGESQRLETGNGDGKVGGAFVRVTIPWRAAPALPQAQVAP